MFADAAVALVAKINNAVSPVQGPPTVGNGQEAIERVFRLMQKTYDHLPPGDIIEADAPALKPKQRSLRLADHVGDRAVDCIAFGCEALAELVEGAWAQGRGEQAVAGHPASTYSEGCLESAYKHKEFLPALTLGDADLAGL